jgi:hypothetical protein
LVSSHRSGGSRGWIGPGPGLSGVLAADAKAPLFKISLAEWSLHKTIQAGKMENLEFPAFAKKCGIDAVEYVNQFFRTKPATRNI